MLPSIFGENLFDDFFGDPFGMMPRGRDPLYGKHARNLMRRQACTTLRENSSSPAYRPITVSRRTLPPNSIFTIFSTK